MMDLLLPGRFSLERSVRHGNRFSLYLFIKVMENVGSSIQAFKIEHETLKLFSFADDIF